MADKPFLVRIPEALHEALRKRAEDEDRSMASLVRRALQDYLRKKPR